MKLRYFYKIDHNKRPILGSNVRRKSRPGNQWKEIPLPCCAGISVPCTCGPRYFVQLDGLGRPVDYSIIKRNAYPKMTDGVKYYELPWQPACCTGTISWSLDINDTTGSLVILVNGVTVVNSSVEEINGSFQASYGDEISIALNNTGPDILTNSLTVNIEGLNFNSTDSPLTLHTFIWNGEPGIISGIIASSEE